MLITGAAGFIGTNSAKIFTQNGYSVLGIDNLSRSTGKNNLLQLNKLENFDFYNLDLVYDQKKIQKIIHNFQPNGVLHLAGQVAVTTSLIDPSTDFNNNAVATFNLLKTIQELKNNVKFIFSSTNKVYGNLDFIPVIEKSNSYIFSNKRKGIDEKVKFQPHSPYGCSKGTADIYVYDFWRSYGLDTYVLRQSCIYGTNQFGIEDQGWVSWFVIAGLLNKKISIYGSGKQVRDLLFVDDLIELYDKILRNKTQKNNRVFNVGGGLSNSISLLGLINKLIDEFKINVRYNHQKERLGDQKIFISNNSLLKREFDWKPTTTINEGLNELINWTKKNLKIIKKYQ